MLLLCRSFHYPSIYIEINALLFLYFLVFVYVSISKIEAIGSCSCEPRKLSCVPIANAKVRQVPLRSKHFPEKNRRKISYPLFLANKISKSSLSEALWGETRVFCFVARPALSSTRDEEALLRELFESLSQEAQSSSARVLINGDGETSTKVLEMCLPDSNN